MPRRLLVLLLLLPTSARAESRSYTLHSEGLIPPRAASELGVRGAIPVAGRHRPRPSWRDEGSARQLRGLVCIEHIFVDDSTATWDLPHRLDVRDSFSKALAYLRDTADGNDVSLDWRETHSSYATSEEVSAENLDHAWTGAAVLRSSSTEARLPRLESCPVRECDQRLAILHVMKPGRSYALPSIAFRDEGVERVVMFMRRVEVSSLDERDVPERASILVPERPAAYVHELLHIFGAEDFYRPAAREREARRRYPAAVMLQSHRPLASLEISDYTAYYVGWSEDEPAALPLDE